MTQINPYMILGLSNDASDEEIKQEYRRKVLKYHPDKIKDESKRTRYETKFKLIKDAYDEIVKQRQQPTTVSQTLNNQQKFGAFPFTTMFQDAFQRMNDFDAMSQQFEQRIGNLNKTFANLDVNHNQGNSAGGKFYSKRVFFSNVNGKLIKKVEENNNGQIHQYEEYDDSQTNRTHQLKKN